MSTEHFEKGKGDGLGFNPVGVPASSTDSSGILLPSSQIEPSQDPTAPVATGRTRRETTPANPVFGHIKEAEKFRTKSNSSTAPKVVHLQDAITIGNGLGSALMTLHQDLHKTGIMHPGLAEARMHLFGDRTLPESHPNYHGALHYLQQARVFAPAKGTEGIPQFDSSGKLLSSTDDLAWESVSKAAPKLMAAQKALASVSPERAADVSFNHTIEGRDLKFTATKGLQQIMGSKTPFRKTGAAPKVVFIDGKKVPASKVRTAVAVDEAAKEQGMAGAGTLRPELIGAAKAASKRVKRTRKTKRPITSTTSMFQPGAKPAATNKIEIEPVGKGAADSNKPKKNFREEDPTAEKGIRNLGRKGE